VEELVPLGFGLLLGAVLGVLRPSLRLPVGAVLAVALGACATIVTGEASISWSYLLVDIPVVSVAAVLGLLAGRRLTPVASRSRSDAP
jgi:hypothetical protein